MSRQKWVAAVPSDMVNILTIMLEKVPWYRIMERHMLKRDIKQWKVGALKIIDRLAELKQAKKESINE